MADGSNSPDLTNGPNVLVMGNIVAPPKIDRTDFDGATGLGDYDLVFWDPAEATSAFGSPPPGGSSFVCNQPQYQALVRHISSRRTQMAQLLGRGGTLVIFVSKPISITYSSVGGGTPNYRAAWEACPEEVGPIEAGEGVAYSVVDSRSSIGQFLASWSGAAKYVASFSLDRWKPDWAPVATTKTPGVLVAAEKRASTGGRVILLPRLNTAPSRAPEGQVQQPREIMSRFWSELIAAVMPLKSFEVEDVPPWAAEYGSEAEFALRDSASAKVAAIQELTAELATIESDLEAYEAIKPLLYASGAELEAAVGEAFVRLGGVPLPARDGYEDLRVQFEDFVAICEVKGVKGGATLQNARQLENWATDPDVPDSAKAILIVNGFRESPPGGRVEEVFSPRVREYSGARQHALLTTTQLFAMVAEVERNPGKLREVVELLRGGSGVVPGFNAEQFRRSWESK